MEPDRLNTHEMVPHASRQSRSSVTDANHFVLTFENNRYASELFGQFDEHLKLIEERLKVDARARGNSVAITGEIQATNQARRRWITFMIVCRRVGRSKPPMSKVRSAWRLPQTTS